MPTMNVSLPQALSDFVEEEVARGDYASASEVVRDGLRLLRREKELHQEKLDLLREEIRIGLDQAERGEFSTRTIAEILTDVEAEDRR